MIKMMAALVALAGLCVSAAAQTDTTFAYQGSLSQNGAPANGLYDIELGLWNAANAGTLLDSAVYEDVHVADGLFTVQLDFGASAFDNSARWLELTVDGSTLSPRQPITRTPYAIQTRGIVVDAEGEVGIGTSSPSENVEITGGEANLLLRTQGNSFGPRIKFRNTSGSINSVTGRIDFEDPSLVASIGYVKPSIGPDGLQFSGSSNVHMKITDTGRVGIGTSDPNRDLHLAGDALFQASSQGSILFADNTTNAPTGYGVSGRTSAPAGAGLSGEASSTSGNNYGVVGTSRSTSGTGVRGVAAATSGSTIGVQGRTESGDGTGVHGFAFAGLGTTFGVTGETRSTRGRGVYGIASATSGNTIGVLGQVNSPNGWAGYFTGPAGSWNYFQRNVGIGVITPTYSLHLNANSAAKPTSDRWTVSSDERLKTEIRTIDGALDDLLRLRGVMYRWRDPASQGGMDGTYTGMIAQEVEPVFPEWVAEDEDGYKTLTIIGFEGLMVEALRELRGECDSQIAILQATSSSLRAENTLLRERLAALEDLVSTLAAQQQESAR